MLDEGYGWLVWLRVRARFRVRVRVRVRFTVRVRVRVRAWTCLQVAWHKLHAP